jgi:hypothetical protein
LPSEHRSYIADQLFENFSAEPMGAVLCASAPLDDSDQPFAQSSSCVRFCLSIISILQMRTGERGKR